jgi:hypothetical protein
MKGLAIYTVVLYGLCLLSIFSEPTKEMWIGMAALCPVFIFAILYLVGSLINLLIPIVGETN